MTPRTTAAKSSLFPTRCTMADAVSPAMAIFVECPLHPVKPAVANTAVSSHPIHDVDTPRTIITTASRADPANTPPASGPPSLIARLRAARLIDKPIAARGRRTRLPGGQRQPAFPGLRQWLDHIGGEVRIGCGRIGPTMRRTCDRRSAYQPRNGRYAGPA